MSPSYEEERIMPDWWKQRDRAVDSEIVIWLALIAAAVLAIILLDG
jgi:hypothetical protein